MFAPFVILLVVHLDGRRIIIAIPSKCVQSTVDSDQREEAPSILHGGDCFPFARAVSFGTSLLINVPALPESCGSVLRKPGSGLSEALPLCTVFPGA